MSRPTQLHSTVYLPLPVRKNPNTRVTDCTRANVAKNRLHRKQGATPANLDRRLRCYINYINYIFFATVHLAVPYRLWPCSMEGQRKQIKEDILTEERRCGCEFTDVTHSLWIYRCIKSLVWSLLCNMHLFNISLNGKSWTRAWFSACGKTSHKQWLLLLVNLRCDKYGLNSCVKNVNMWLKNNYAVPKDSSNLL